MSAAAPVTPTHPVAPLYAILIKAVALSAEVRLLTFAVLDKPRLEFHPGQSIRIELQAGGKPVSLAYSIASPPAADNIFELCVKSGRKGSLPERLFDLRMGAQIRFSPPQGDFVLHQADEARVFLAAGTGIAPIRSMVHSLIRSNGHHAVDLLFGARDTESLFFHSEFLELARRHPRFVYLPILSRPNDGWDGARGHVQHHLARISSGKGRVYLCGPAGMVKDATAALTQMGWPDHLLHYDRC